MAAPERKADQPAAVREATDLAICLGRPRRNTRRFSPSPVPRLDWENGHQRIAGHLLCQRLRADAQPLGHLRQHTRLPCLLVEQLWFGESVAGRAVITRQLLSFRLLRAFAACQRANIEHRQTDKTATPHSPFPPRASRLPPSRLPASPPLQRATDRCTFHPVTITLGGEPPRSRTRYVAVTVRVSPGSSER